ncbi:hypothetical protein HU200_030418 [Digitaria exilis]|uniref:C2H2-type domain-containing protein n=1 Tax=Digitaria exilis TaxID=1010633 RepID=A0A835ESA6_9POAL|nr:hypothetical protein HU200_030418 [Digitaria exilis]
MDSSTSLPPRRRLATDDGDLEEGEFFRTTDLRRVMALHQMPTPPLSFSEQAQLLHQLAAAPPLPQVPQLVASQRADQPRREYTYKKKCADYVCRKCQKVFSTGYALGGHMRVHFTGPPIGPTRKSKEKSLALLPVEHDIVVPSSPDISLTLSIKTPSPVLAGRLVRLFGIDIRV